MKGYVGDAALQVFTEGGSHLDAARDSLDAFFAAAGRVAPTARPSSSRARPPLDDKLLDVQVRRQVGEMGAELGTALRAELAAELRRLIPRPPATAEQATSTVPRLVQNDRTKVVHVVAMGPDDIGESTQWVSLCTWEFGRWGGFSLVGGALAVPICERCLSRGPK